MVNKKISSSLCDEKEANLNSPIKISSQKWSKSYRSLVDWNHYQLQVFDTAKDNRDRNILVKARAGSGKTTCILGLTACLKGKIQIVAFNKHIADKLKNESRIPHSRVKVSTTHSLGLKLIGQELGDIRLKVNNDKYKNLLKSYLKKHNIDLLNIVKSLYPEILDLDPEKQKQALTDRKKELRKGLIDLIDKLRINLLDCNLANIVWCIDRYKIFFPLVNLLINIVSKVLSYGDKLARLKGEIDYADMIWLPNKWQISIQYCPDTLIADECQDANPAVLGIYEAYFRAGAQIILIGDREQSIFGFAGSDYSVWDRYLKTFNPIILSLPICYRCPTSHINLTNKLIPDIKPFKGASLGNLSNCNLDTLIKTVKPKDLVICRFSLPLFEVCLACLAKGKKAYIRGRDIKSSIISLIKTVSEPWENINSEFKRKLDNYYFQRYSELKESDQEKSAFILKDKYTIIVHFLKEVPLKGNTVQDLINRISDLFEGNPEESIIFSTIHRAKGDEADTVWLLNSHELPFLKKCNFKSEIQQELNLVYVALTRAKENLFFVLDKKICTSIQSNLDLKKLPVSNINFNALNKLN